MADLSPVIIPWLAGIGPPEGTARMMGYLAQGLIYFDLYLGFLVDY